MRNFELPGRSPVHAANGMAATSHPLATLTAINILQSGGNAMDAAIAACAVQCVVEPQSTGIGGDCFMLYAPKGSGQIIAFNGSGRTPAAATTDWYLEQGYSEIERCTPHAVTVPGAVDAWARLNADHGSKPLAELLQSAITYARDGYPVYSRVASDWAREVDTLKQSPHAADVFLTGGTIPIIGSMHKQPKLAETLALIASQGRDAFYTGPVAEDIVSYLRSLGGFHTLEDFAQAEGEYVTPIKTHYRGYDVFECPPNGQGITALIMLNIMQQFDLSKFEPISAEYLHLEIEAKRLAYNDRDRFVGDPAHSEVPIEQLLAPQYGADLAGMIKPESVLSELPISAFPQHPDTVYLCVVDRDGNAISFINSLFHSFGSALMSPNTGVFLHSRGSSFVVDPEHPNRIAPNKRPLHTIIPGMLAKDGRAVMPFGVMGGHYQAVGHVHLLTGLIDFDLDVQEALDLPRLFAEQQGGVEAEGGIAQNVLAALGDIGHTIKPCERPLGGGQAIMIDWQRGVLTGGSDPRKDGCALGY